MEKKQSKKAYSDLDEMFGNAFTIDCFTDNKARKLKPVTLKNFSEFMSNLGMINFESMWLNFINDETIKFIREVLAVSFTDENPDELMEVIDARNFKQVVDEIMKINGINLGGGNEEDSKKKG